MPTGPGVRVRVESGLDVVFDFIFGCSAAARCDNGCGRMGPKVVAESNMLFRSCLATYFDVSRSLHGCTGLVGTQHLRCCSQ